MASGDRREYDPKVRITSDIDAPKQLMISQCYLCPGNLRAKGDRNPNYTDTFIFENDYSTVRMDEGEYDANMCKKGVSSQPHSAFA